VSTCDELNSKNLEAQADCEMAAFLKAATELLGASGRHRAADTWRQTMESLDWPEEDYRKFFRFVSILAISQLVECRFGKKAASKRGNRDRTGWLPILQTAH